jgi:hypothetical protein
MTLPSLPQDKANHYIYGSIIYVTAWLFIAHVQLPVTFFSTHATYTAWAITVMFAFGKELTDAIRNKHVSGDYMQGPHGVEFPDALATIAGGTICALPHIFS